MGNTIENKSTLQEGWDVFYGELRQKRAYQEGEHLQAFKNGAAAVVARVAVRGILSILQYKGGDRIFAAEAMRDILEPAWLVSKRAHPEWNEYYHDSLIAGGLTALVSLIAGETCEMLYSAVRELR